MAPEKTGFGQALWVLEAGPHGWVCGLEAFLTPWDMHVTVTRN